MNKAASVALLIALMFRSGGAQAIEVMDVIGKWVEDLPNGRGVMTEFKPTEMITSQVDVFGIPTVSVSQPITGYRDLKGSIAVDLPGGKTGPTLYEKDHSNILMVYPGQPAHRLMRVQER